MTARLRARGSADRSQLVWFVALALALVLFFLWLFAARGFQFPVGSDAPVYMWWARLVTVDGLSAIGRPGVPALLLALTGTLHLPLVAVTAALQCVLGVAVGTAGAALLRAWRPEDRATCLTGGLLTGTFAAHLVSGYLANVALAAAFIAAASALALETRRGALAAAALLAAGGFAHPEFLLVGLGILGLTAALGWGRRAERGEVRSSEPPRIVAAIVGATLILGAGFLSLVPGPEVLRVDTSRDAFLRRFGLLDTLRHLYRDRFVHRAARYVQWVSVPLAGWALATTVRGFVGRFLAAWGVVTVAGVAFGLSTALVPPDRFVTFGYVVPLLAAVGVVRLSRTTRLPRVAATAIAAALVLLMVLGAFLAWRREAPFMTVPQVASVEAASRWIEGTSPNTPLFFVIERANPTITFFATQAANAIRAAVPPGRIREVRIFVPSDGGLPSSERAVLARSTLADWSSAIAGTATSPLVIRLRPFEGPAFGLPLPGIVGSGLLSARVAPDVEIGTMAGRLPDPGRPPADPLKPSSAGRIAITAFAALALLAAGGYGWGRATGFDVVASAALAPAFGLGALTLAAIALERTGVPLTGRAGPILVSLLAGGGGHVVRFVSQRGASCQPPA